MKNFDFWEVSKFISSTLQVVSDELDNEVINSINHFLIHDEYEMAFEILFMEIIKLNQVPKIDFSKSKSIGMFLQLHKESVFFSDFWIKFKKYLKNLN